MGEPLVLESARVRYSSGESAQEGPGDGHARLQKKIAHELRRIVPTGILEIDECDGISAIDGIVEAEIRGRHHALCTCERMLRRRIAATSPGDTGDLFSVQLALANSFMDQPDRI